jgi:putative membrane-bound dehydrogenase-like protein
MGGGSGRLIEGSGGGGRYPWGIFKPMITRFQLFRVVVWTIAAGGGSLTAAPLFDGKSLDGWTAGKGDEKWWRAEDGMITGGSLEETVPHNTFLVADGSYQNFELNFKIRFTKGEGFINSGLQLRSQRVEGSSEMQGYQVDAGGGYWGDLYDESRRNVAVVKGDGGAMANVVKDWDWNEYRILGEGRRIRTWINGALAHDYTEADAAIPQDGKIGLQAHGGGKFLVQVKDISITPLPETPGLPKWETAKIESPRTPEQERTGFHLPAGFEVELVASEAEGVGKPVTMVWDKSGKMWTMTALEYPVDANENLDSANALFARGGRDKVLIFDHPNAPGPQTPRVFADGLAIPLGVLPYRDGALVQYGTEIRYYADTDGDGKADRHETVLEGFGIQDSHLFPHQFERMPGDWVSVAQGAFNRSVVKRPGGLKFAGGEDAVIYNQCRLARFRPDGSDFEILGVGLNNIWGISQARSGETFIQEANDLGYPVTEFLPGNHYPGNSGGKLRDDAPVMPTSTKGNLMGGTGLSGLAMAEDSGSPFRKGYGDAGVFYLANPITRKLQIVTQTRDADGHAVFEKREDFLLSDDPWFRPVSVRFGPDGCLYIADWYNKIISHNEVPRTHPDRDKTHGRIWRVRATGQQIMPEIDVAKMSDDELLEHLGGAGSRVAAMAWQEIGDRKAVALAPRLEELVADEKSPLARRLGAVWALEGLGKFPVARLVTMAKAGDSELRHEAIRIAGEASLAEADFVAVTDALKDEKNYRVRAAIANAVRGHRAATPAIVKAAARLGLAPLSGNDRLAYDRNFERYLARWAMAVHPEATREMLKSADDLEIEARLLAVRSLPDAEAAGEMLRLLPQIQRPLVTEELALLGNQIGQPSVLAGLRVLLDSPAQREPVLIAMNRLDRQTAANPELAKIVAGAVKQLLAEKRSSGRERLAIQLARRFRLAELEDEVMAWVKWPKVKPPELAEGLGTLREIGVRDLAVFRPYLDHADEAVKREAVTGFGAVDSVEVVAEFSRRWNGLSGALRNLAVDGMTSSAVKATAFAAALDRGEFEGFDGSAVEKLIAMLGIESAPVQSVLKTHAALLKPVIQLNGDPKGCGVTAVDLTGPFTVESWVRLDPGIDANDTLIGRPGGGDFNFFDGKFRLFGGQGIGDLIIARRAVRPDEWTHCAITRNADGKFKLYLDGELDQDRSQSFAGPLTGLNLGDSTPRGGTAGQFDEIRIWNVERSAEEILRDHRVSFAGDAALPAGLAARFAGDTAAGLKLEGGAKIALTRNFPELITTTQAAELAAKFDRFRVMTNQAGDAAAGKALMQTTCLICHQVAGQGMTIGPNLSGAGAMGTEALLRNILTPNAQLESGYYRHDLKLRDGSMVSGFLAGETGDSLTVRQIGTDERVISKGDVESHAVSKRSLMPEGLIDQFSARQVADLFAYLKTLK